MTRDQRLIVLSVLVAVISAALVGAHFATDDPPPRTAALHRDVPVGADRALSLQFVGNTLLADASHPGADEGGSRDWPDDRVPLTGTAPLLDGDIVVAAAEGPITVLSEPWDADGLDGHNMYPPAARALAGAGVDVLSLANSRVMNRGPAGLLDTQVYGQQAALSLVGAGANTEEARRPLVLHTDVGKVGIVAFDAEGRQQAAGQAQPGTAVLDLAAVRDGIDRARTAGADWVVASIHWSGGHRGVSGKQRYWAQQLAHAGYSLVVGSGSGGPQSLDVVDGVPVAYGLGDFVVGTPGSFGREATPGVGLDLTVRLGVDEPARLQVRCISTDNAAVRYRPVPCSPEQSRAFIPTLYPGIAMQGDTGVLAFTPTRAVAP